MISGLAAAYRVLQDEDCLRMAEYAARFVRKSLYNETNCTLLRNYRDTASDVMGFSDDYAYMIQGLLGEFSWNFPFDVGKEFDVSMLIFPLFDVSP